MRHGTRILPAIVLPLLLAAATGCASTAPKPAADARAGALTTAAPGIPPGPAAAPTPAGGSTDGPATAAVATPAPDGRAPARPAGGAGVRLVAYDPGTGRAALSAPTTGGPDADPVRAGRLIASPPSPAAPHGALVSVTGVGHSSGGRTEVTTRPAAVTELLGTTATSLHAAVDPHTITVQPLVKDLTTSFTGHPGGGAGSASARLTLDAHTAVPLPGGATAALAAGIELDPAVDFSYDGTRLLQGGPERARVGFTLGSHATWRIDAALGAGAAPLRIPIARLSADPVLTVAGFPVVVNLDLTCYLTVSADGTVTVDTEQDLDGRWAVHADYLRGRGWTSAADPGSTEAGPVRARLAGHAAVRTGLASEAGVGLYGAVGVRATVEPYLTTRVDGTVTLNGSGRPPVVAGSWSTRAGLDVTGTVFARISVLGTPVFSADLPLPALHREWPVPPPH
ncbi:hypothetical protein ACFQMG_16285 [Kitasatospora paranensis]|uniref:Lipoprotein n=1 Tax=Kitasatospora paranensis TaxID=258053 RepID=A0ABW2FXH3_9ACTN